VRKRVAVLIKEKERQYEGVRSSLGLLLGQHIVSMFVLNHELEVPEEFQDNISIIDDMGGGRYSNVASNMDKYGFKLVTLEQVAHQLKENEVIIPF
jgi:hypothetical protein